jgi:hypothetical protein
MSNKPISTLTIEWFIVMGRCTEDDLKQSNLVPRNSKLSNPIRTGKTVFITVRFCVSNIGGFSQRSLIRSLHRFRFNFLTVPSLWVQFSYIRWVTELYGTDRFIDFDFSWSMRTKLRRYSIRLDADAEIHGE